MAKRTSVSDEPKMHAAPGKHAAKDDEYVAARLTIDVPNQPKVSVDKDMFEKVKDGLAYVVEDPFSGELRLHALKWTGRVITGVDWEGPLQ